MGLSPGAFFSVEDCLCARRARLCRLCHCHCGCCSPLPWPEQKKFLPARPQISIVDGRKLESEGGTEAALERCEILANKQGQPLLAHGRSGSYTDSKRVLVPMIHGQALLPDLKITDSSEALLTGRAPPFRLAVRAVHRSGEQFEGVEFALSDPFVVSEQRECQPARQPASQPASAVRAWLSWEFASCSRGWGQGQEGLTEVCSIQAQPGASQLAPAPPSLTPLCAAAAAAGAGGHRAGQGRRQAGDPAHRGPRQQDRLRGPAGGCGWLGAWVGGWVGGLLMLRR